MTRTLEGYQLAQRYRGRIAQLGLTTASSTAQLLALWQAGDLDGDEWLEATAARIAAAKTAAATLSDNFLADLLSVELDDPIDPLGLDAPGYTDTALLASMLTSIRDRADREPHLVGLVARTEPSTTGRIALGDAMRSRRQVEGWRRLTSGSPCDICTRLADGAVLPPQVDVAAHPHCSCTALPVVRDVPDRYRPPTGAEISAGRDGQPEPEGSRDG